MLEPSPETIDAFISKWTLSGGHERGAGHYFMLEVGNQELERSGVRIELSNRAVRAI
jgi:hypothetical protein